MSCILFVTPFCFYGNGLRVGNGTNAVSCLFLLIPQMQQSASNAIIQLLLFFLILSSFIVIILLTMPGR